MTIQKANKNDVRKEIADLINRIKEQSDRIGVHREIPQHELDLILYRIEELHKKTVVWAYLNELPAEVSALNNGSQFSVLVSEEKAPTVETPNIVQPPPTQEPAKVVETIEEIVAPIATKNEEFRTENREQRTESNTEKLVEKTSLKDVRSFIGINEKIMYIRQVFKGDDIAYNTAIEKFNNMNSWSEAQSYLTVLASEYKWGKHDEPSEIFTQTVKRRFS